MLLVSAGFMGSPYCTKIELSEALNLASTKDAIIVPVIAETCDWEAMPIRNYAALPKDKTNNLKPLNKWRQDRDVTLTQIAKQRRHYVETLSQR
jgi:hypothetical protein